MGPSAGKPIPKVSWDASRDKKITDKAKELLESDPEVKALQEKNPYLAWRKAIAKAAGMFPVKGGGFGGTPGDIARAHGDQDLELDDAGPKANGPLNKLSRDDRLQAVALTMLKTDPDLVQLAKSDSYGAYKRAVQIANSKLDQRGNWIA
jgi:hypothetical protein